MIAKDTAVDAVPSDFIDADSDADADADASEDAEETKRDRTVIIVPKKRKDRTVIVPRKGSRKSRKRVIVVPDRQPRKKVIIVPDNDATRHSGRSYHGRSSHATSDCDFGSHAAVAGNGNQLYGSDCTYSKTSCMPPMT